MKRDFEGCQKEFYYSEWVRYKLYFYDGKLYYLNPRGICRSNEDGSEIELIVEMDLSKYGIYLGMTSSELPEIIVNSTGIYFHDDDEVRRYSFDGKLINEISTAGDHIYIYKTKIFYTTYDPCGYCVDIETGERKQFCKQARQINKLYGTDKYAVINATYKGGNPSRYPCGWYLFNFETEKYICLSSNKYPPHLVLSHPEYFDKDGYALDENDNTNDIFRFDLTRGIMWVRENKKLKPKTFLNGVNDIDGIFEWPDTPSMLYSASFFNGEVFFDAEDHFSYSAYDREGNKHSYSTSDGHGFCNYSAIHNNLLYMQMNYRECQAQYKIENGEITKLRDGWFNEEPKETEFGFTVWDDSNL